MRVLLVEDEPNVAAFVMRGLSEEGFVVDHAASKKDSLALVGKETYDVLVVDRRLPDGDGLELVRLLRGQGLATPIIVLSVMARLEHRVTGLNAGADDYLAKPFSFTELLARVRALLRRGRAPLPALLKVGDLELELATHRVLANGKSLELTPREFALLLLFMRYPGETLTRATIGEQVWDYHFESGSNVIDVYVRRLRKDLEKAGAAATIETVRGAGYALLARTREAG
jgi:two-component system OmpR family response regulator